MSPYSSPSISQSTGYLESHKSYFPIGLLVWCIRAGLWILTYERRNSPLREKPARTHDRRRSCLRFEQPCRLPTPLDNRLYFLLQVYMQGWSRVPDGWRARSVRYPSRSRAWYRRSHCPCRRVFTFDIVKLVSRLLLNAKRMGWGTICVQRASFLIVSVKNAWFEVWLARPSGPFRVEHDTEERGAVTSFWLGDGRVGIVLTAKPKSSPCGFLRTAACTI